MPIGQHADFAACVAANQDKDDPHAYCAALEEASKRFEVVKLDEAEHLVFGWASVSVRDGDELLTDLQGDRIEPEQLEEAAYDFVEHSREANEMHQSPPVGQLVESFALTPEKLDVMGLLRKSAPKVAYWVGFRVSPAVFAKVKAGQLPMFSIEGTAERVAA